MARYISIITFILCCCCACNQHHETKGDTASSDDAFHSFVMQVQKCSRIYTTEVKIHKIVTHDDVIRLKGTILAQDFNIKMPLGDRKIAIPMDATLKAFIDMSDFSEKNVERDGQKIIITLPDPIIASIPQLGIISTAQENAARVLVPLITQMGYQEQDIVIQFRKEYGIQDIKSLVNMDIEHGKK